MRKGGSLINSRSKKPVPGKEFFIPEKRDLLGK
jgi:hypothetical protein